MAKNGVISFYKNEEFNDWLYDIGKKRGLYDSYINTLDEDNKLSSDIKLDDAKKIVDKLLKDVDDKIKTSIGKDKKYNRSRRSGLRSYKRFLSYIPTYYISYTYNGIKELAELFQISNTSLIKYMISHSLFAPPELVRKRAEEIAVLIVNDDKIPARFSTGEKYRNVSTGSKEKFKSRTDGKNKTIQSDFRYIDNEIKVCPVLNKLTLLKSKSVSVCETIVE